MAEIGANLRNRWHTGGASAFLLGKVSVHIFSVFKDNKINNIILHLKSDSVVTDSYSVIDIVTNQLLKCLT